jgi:hypothetical protein
VAQSFRGGRPFSRQLSVTTSGEIGIAGSAVASVQAAGRPYEFPLSSSELQFEVTSGTEVRVYFSQEAYDGDYDAIKLLSGKRVVARLNASKVWMKAFDSDAVVDILGAGQV